MKTTLLFLSVFLSANLFGQNVYIPDANFKAYLLGNSQINTNGDFEIQVSEASAFDGLIECNNSNISDLTGIEAFVSLTKLECGNNPLTSLDVSYNTALTYLVCVGNQLTSLDVSNNTALTDLYCLNNNLTSLDISNNTALTFLACESNQLTSLDVSNNTALTFLACYNNNLTALDVSNNTALTSLGCHSNQLTCLNVANGNNANMPNGFFSASNNPNLTCIEVDDAVWSTSNWPGFQASFSEDCNNDCSSSTVGINQLTSSKYLIRILDLMGRETTFKPNTPLIYVYDDGSTEKVFSVEY
jgi:Leucine-rich repeat (LRR) protein